MCVYVRFCKAILLPFSVIDITQMCFLLGEKAVLALKGICIPQGPVPFNIIYIVVNICEGLSQHNPI